MSSLSDPSRAFNFLSYFKHQIGGVSLIEWILMCLFLFGFFYRCQKSRHLFQSVETEVLRESEAFLLQEFKRAKKSRMPFQKHVLTFLSYEIRNLIERRESSRLGKHKKTLKPICPAGFLSTYERSILVLKHRNANLLGGDEVLFIQEQTNKRMASLWGTLFDYLLFLLQGGIPCPEIVFKEHAFLLGFCSSEELKAKIELDLLSVTCAYLDVLSHKETGILKRFFLMEYLILFLMHSECCAYLLSDLSCLKSESEGGSFLEMSAYLKIRYEKEWLLKELASAIHQIEMYLQSVFSESGDRGAEEEGVQLSEETLQHQLEAMANENVSFNSELQSLFSIKSELNQVLKSQLILSVLKEEIRQIFFRKKDYLKKNDLFRCLYEHFLQQHVSEGSSMRIIFR